MSICLACGQPVYGPELLHVREPWETTFPFGNVQLTHDGVATQEQVWDAWDAYRRGADLPDGWWVEEVRPIDMLARIGKLP